MDNQLIYCRLTLLVVVTTLSACSNNAIRGDSTADELAEDHVSKIVEHTVQPGDRLSDIALEYTGEQSKWREIAEYNGITDPRTLQQGVVLQIPAEFIPGYQGESALKGETPSATTKETEVAQQTLKTTKQNGEVVSASLAVKRSVDTPSDQSPETKVLVTPVKTNREFDLNPIAGASEDGAPSETDVQRFIKVIGTYYPKGVYAQPAAYSDLIMRVAPGTTFALDRKIDDWYRVILDEGTGYIRASDAEITSDTPENTTPVASSRG